MPTREEVLERAERLLGSPFKSLPGNPPDHHVVGRFSDGTRITVQMVEMIMNDAWLMDSLHGAGEYARTTKQESILESVNGGGKQWEAFELAVSLYGCQPIDLKSVN
jgi:hypothetical protein